MQGNRNAESIEPELKRNFYATICMKEIWSVRKLRERKNSKHTEVLVLLQRKG